MQAYRDQYASLFNNGQGVVVIGISNDAAPAHAEWLAAEDFPFLFATENAGATYESFGGVSRDDDRPGTRAVIIVGPDGRVAHVIPAFLQTDPRAYEELGAAVDRIAGPGGR